MDKGTPLQSGKRSFDYWTISVNARSATQLRRPLGQRQQPVNFHQLTPEHGIVLLVGAQQEQGVRTVAKQARFSLCGSPTNVNQQWQVTPLNIEANAFRKVTRPRALDANQPYLVLVKLVEPVPLAIRACAQSVMRDTALTQHLCQVVEQYRFPSVGWPTKQDSG